MASVVRMRIGLPKNLRPGASYRKADIATKYVGISNRANPTTAETSFEKRGRIFMSASPSPHPVNLTREGVRQTAPRPLAMTKLHERGLQIRDGEIRPRLPHKHKFRECTFPQEKIGQAL